MSSRSFANPLEQDLKVATSLRLTKKQASGAKPAISVRTEESEYEVIETGLVRPLSNTHSSLPKSQPLLLSPQQKQYYKQGQERNFGMRSYALHSPSQAHISNAIISPAVASKAQLGGIVQSSNQQLLSHSHSKSEIMRGVMAQSHTIGVGQDFSQERALGQSHIMGLAKDMPYQRTLVQNQITGAQQTQITGVSKEITYETQAVKTTNFVQVPVYEAQYVDVKEETVLVGMDAELLRLKLLLQEKDLELEVYRAKAAEAPKEPKPMFMQLLEGARDGGDSDELRLKNMQLEIEIKALREQIEEFKQKFKLIGEELDEKQGLLDHEKEKAKKAGVPKAPEITGVDPRLVKELEARINSLEEELMEKSRFIEQLRIQNSEGERGRHELIEKLKLTEQQKDNLVKGQKVFLDELEQLRPLRNLIDGLKADKARVSADLQSKDKELKEVEERARRRVGELERGNQQLARENEELKGRVERIAKDLEGKRVSCEQFEKEINGLRSRVKELESTITQFLREKDNWEQEKKDFSSKLNSLTLEFEAKLKAVEIEREGLLRKREELEKIIESLTKDKESLAKELQTLKFDCQNAEISFKAQLDGLSKQLEEKTQRINELQEQLRTSSEKSQSLSQELESLKLTLKTLESTNQEKIKGLSEQLQELKRNIQKYEASITELNQKNQNLNQEISNLKRVLQNQEEEISKRFQSQITELEKNIERLNREKGNLGKELESLKNDINNQKARFETEIESYRSEIVSLKEEIQRNNNSWKEEREKLVKEIQSYQIKIQETNKLLEDRLAEKQQELQKLRNEYESRLLIVTKENESLQGKVSSLEGRIHDLIKDHELRIKELNEKLIIITKERSVLQSSFDEQAKDQSFFDFQGQLKAMESKYEDLLNKYRLQIESLSKDYDAKLKDLSNQKDDDIKRLIDGFNSKQVSYESQIREWSSKFDGLGADLEGRNKSLLRDLEALKQRIRDLESEKIHYEEKISVCVEEITKYQGEIKGLKTERMAQMDIIQGQGKEIELLKQKIKDFESDRSDSQRKSQEYFVEIESLKGRIRDLEREKGELSLNVQEFIRTIESLKERLRGLDGRSQDHSREIEALLEKIKILERENLGFKEKIEEYVIVIQNLKETHVKEMEEIVIKLNKIQLELTAQISAYEALKLEYNKVKEELDNANNRLLMYENKIAILSGEVNRLTNQGRKKDAELEDLRRRAGEFEASMGNYQKTIEEYDTRIYKLTDDNTRGLMTIVMMAADMEQMRGRWVEKKE